ncbi:MAG: AMP-binding protein [Chitinophagales bacterium]
MSSTLSFSGAEHIASQQLLLLQKQLQFIKECSPFYKERLAAVNPQNLRHISDLATLPFTTKDDFHTHSEAFLCVQKNQIIDYSTTSGTTGKPVVVALTESDLLRLAENEAQSFACAGAVADDVFQLMLTLDRQFMAGMAYAMGLRKIGAGMVRLGPGPPAQQWESILRFQPTGLVAVPSFLIRLLDYAKANGINPNQTSVKKIVCIGEPLRHFDFSPNPLATRISAQWQVPLYSTYASTEMQTAFTECECGCGGHLIPELLIAEVIGEKDEVLGEGEIGELVITHLGVEGMPLLRYRTGDMVARFDTPCACGRNSMRLSPVMGRKNQLIKFKGTTLYPPAIIEAINSIAAVSDFLIRVTKNELEVDILEVFISQRGNMDETDLQLREVLQRKLRVLPEIHFVSNHQLQEMRPADSRKPVTVMFA